MKHFDIVIRTTGGRFVHRLNLDGLLRGQDFPALRDKLNEVLSATGANACASVESFRDAPPNVEVYRPSDNLKAMQMGCVCAACDGLFCEAYPAFSNGEELRHETCPAVPRPDNCAECGLPRASHPVRGGCDYVPPAPPRPDNCVRCGRPRAIHLQRGLMRPVNNCAYLAPAPPAKGQYTITITDVCIAGEPAVNGICGSPECVCAPTPGEMVVSQPRRAQ